MPLTRRRWLLLAIVIAIAAVTAYLLWWPTAVDPESWAPPEAKTWPVNQKLAGATLLYPELVGPEAILIDPEGRLVTGLVDGRIVRLSPSGDGPITTIANTGGRPLGLAYDARGQLIVADATRGLLSVSPAGEITVLATGHGGRRFRFTDDVAIAQDGIIYFTDASDHFTVTDYRLEIVEHRPRGRVLAYDPQTRAVTLIADKLYFANGITLGPGDAYLVVTETSSYRLRRIWLTGDRRGDVETLVDNLPGFPDNVRFSPAEQVFWVAIGSPRNHLLDSLAPHPFLREMIVRLPRALQPSPEAHSFALAFDSHGRVVHDLQATGDGAYAPVASVIDDHGILFLGSFMAHGIARLPAPSN